MRSWRERRKLSRERRKGSEGSQRECDLGVGVREEGGFAVGEEAFEEDGGGYLVDEVFAVDGFAVAASGGAGGVTGCVEAGVGFLGGVTLVEEVMREVGVGGAELGGEGLSFGGLGAGGAIGVERVADEEDLDAVLADEAGDGLEVGAEVGAVHGEERLRGEAEGVGEG